MPSITQTPNGKYRAQVYVNKTRDSQVFRTKREAVAWASARETELRGNIGKHPSEIHTLGHTLRKYIEEVSPTKRGSKKEIIRLNAMLRMLPIDKPLSEIGSEVIQRFRDERMKVVKPNSVLRELGSLSAVFDHAKVEWKWIESNPVREIRKPQRPGHRKVMLTREQIKALLRQFGYSPSCAIDSIGKSIAVMLLVSLRTGLRSGEACGLKWGDVGEHSCHVSGKTEAADRDVPLTDKAVRLIEKMRGFDDDYVFSVKDDTRDAMFRKARGDAGLSGFTWHDTRHTAATWIVNNGTLNPFELCKVFGWTDPKMAMIYFNPTAKDLLKRMANRT